MNSFIISRKSLDNYLKKIIQKILNKHFFWWYDGNIYSSIKTELLHAVLAPDSEVFSHCRPWRQSVTGFQNNNGQQASPQRKKIMYYKLQAFAYTASEYIHLALLALVPSKSDIRQVNVLLKTWNVGNVTSPPLVVRH